jgi:hypothetical protein
MEITAFIEFTTDITTASGSLYIHDYTSVNLRYYFIENFINDDLTINALVRDTGTGVCSVKAISVYSYRTDFMIFSAKSETNRLFRLHVKTVGRWK